MAVYPIEGTPFWDYPGNQYPAQHSRSSAEGYLTAPASGDALTVALDYLKDNAAAFGLTAADLNRTVVTDRYTSSDTGTTHLYMQQTYNGLPVADATISIHVAADGQIVSAAANFVRNLVHPATNTPPVPTISASDAVDYFAYAAGISAVTSIQNGVGTGFNQSTTVTNPDLSLDPIPAQLVYVPSPSGGVELAWSLLARTPDGKHWYEGAVGATNERPGQVIRLGDRAKNLSYTVFPRPTQDPLFGPRVVLTAPHDPVASPFGWHDTNGVAGAEFQDTRGNNVFAQEDTNGDNLLGNRPTGGPTLDFNPPLDFTQPPLFNQEAGIVNAFYWTNLAHDVLSRHGFDEAAGNLQVTNYSGAGLGGDQVFVDTQDPTIANNAISFVAPEGTSSRLSIGVFNLTAPARDGAFDATIITHEYFHNATNRLTGGPRNVGGLFTFQGFGLDEGWADWFAMLMTAKPGDTKFTPRTTGNWVLGQQASGPGVRQFPYSFSMQVNPLTFADYNGFDPLTGITNILNSGEIWTSVLWDMTWLLIEKYGFSSDLFNGQGGNNEALRLVLKGLKLQPATPTFIQARDAIISADFALNGGENFEEIWTAFARRGFGFSASSGVNANSVIVTEAFDKPAGPGRVRGTVYNDVNGNGQRDASEAGLAGWTVYNDTNDNGQLDAGEKRTKSRADGSYSLPFFSNQGVIVRQMVQSDFKQTAPENNGARRLGVVRGQVSAGQDFGNQERPGEIRGLLWNDSDGDGVRDQGEAGTGGIVVYVDLNNNSRLDLLEPGGITDGQGNLIIRGIRPGSYTVRVALNPGQTQTFPLVNAPYLNVVITPNDVTPNINFGVATALDFGDAPDSYGTTLTTNGPRHGNLANFHLGARIDFEGNGVPSADALGDDVNGPVTTPPTNPDDEDGVEILGGITPGGAVTIRVTVNASGASPGKLQGWIDFNRDGDFGDSGERVIANRRLGTGVHTIDLPVPTNVSFGRTFARFRYGFENDLGPTGPSVAGEVEDYTIDVLSNVPIARPDSFPRPGEALIKQGSVDNVLDVLANDTGTTFGPPTIIPGSFPASLPTGSTLKLNAAGDRILFSPGPFSLGAETFSYRVSDGNSQSAPAVVTVNISIADPRAVDDSVIVPFVAGQPPTRSIPALANDFFPFQNTQIVSVSKLSLGVSGDSMSIASGGTSLNFVPPAGFKGTIIYEYTIREVPDNTATADAKARVTVQVVDVVAGVPQPVPPTAPNGHQAQFLVDILDPVTGLPLSIVNVDQTFLVRVTSEDLRPAGSDGNRGVETAYVDLIFDSNLVEPVLSASNPLGMEIEFDSNPPSPPGPAGPPTYNSAQNGTANAPAPGSINEVGGSHLVLSGPPVGLGQKAVFSILMRAKAGTSAGQPTQIFGDPADIDPFTRITLSSESPGDPINFPPVVVTDEQVFLRPSATLTIIGSGEGEFTNQHNPLDVNNDTFVTPLDALVVINSLNSDGARQLSQVEFAAAGLLPLENFVDVNLDGYLTPLDALFVFNRLNGLLASGGEGERGEGEDTVAAAIDGGVDESESLEDTLLDPVLFDDEPGDSSEVLMTTTASGGAKTLTAPTLRSLFASAVRPASGSNSGTQSSQTPKISADAADEVFADLFASSGSGLRPRPLRRR